MSRSKKTEAKKNKARRSDLNQKLTEQEVSVRLKHILMDCIHSLKPVEYAKRPGRDFTRDRKLPLDKFLMYLIDREGGSIAKTVIDGFDSGERMSTPAVIEREDQLAPEVMRTLFEMFNEACLNAGIDDKTMDGYHVYAVDGSDINIAFNPDSDSYISGANGKPGCNLDHLSVFYDLMNHTYAHCVVKPNKQKNERQQMVEALQLNDFPEKSIIIADRGYAGFNVFEWAHRTPNVDFLIRIKDNELNEVRNQPKAEWDKDITFELSTRQTRELKAGINDGAIHLVIGNDKDGKPRKNHNWDFEDHCFQENRIVRINVGTEDDPIYETLATSLDRFQFPLSKLKTLYNLRWKIENSFRELKYGEGLQYLHTKREDFVIFEIFAKLIAFNLCERVITNTVIVQAEGLKYEYAINHVLAIHIVMLFLRRENAPPIEEDISRNLVPIRPGRKDERKIIPKTFTEFDFRVAC